jgi:uncharacterized membrane protein YfcA
MWTNRTHERLDRDGHPLPPRGKLVAVAIVTVGGIVYGVLGIVNRSISWTIRRRSFTGSGRSTLRFAGTEAQVFGAAIVVVCLGLLLVTHSYWRDDHRTRIAGFAAMALGAVGGVVGVWTF